MESKTAKKKFCSDLHRLYYHRELKRGTLNLPKVGQEVLGLGNGNKVTERKQHNHAITLTTTPNEPINPRLATLQKIKNK